MNATVPGAVNNHGEFSLSVAYPSTVSTSQAQPGDTVHLTADDLVPGETVEVWLHSVALRLQSGAADSNGHFEVDVTIPTDTTPGTHQLEIRAAQSSSKFHDPGGHYRGARGKPDRPEIPPRWPKWGWPYSSSAGWPRTSGRAGVTARGADPSRARAWRSGETGA